MSKDFPSGYDEASEAPTVGYNHHTSSNARSMARSNPVAGALGKVASLLPRRRPEPSGRQPRQAAGGGRAERARAGSSRAAFSGDDYLGTGDPCRICGRPVEPTMSRCPHCGSLRVPLYQQVPFWIAVAVLVLLVVLLTLAVNSCSTPATTTVVEPEDEQVEVDPDDPVAQDKSGLQASLDQAQGYIDENAANGTYTVASVNTLQAAMDETSAVLNDETATESRVTEVQQLISDAITAMRVCPTGYDGYSWLDYQTIVNSASVGMQSSTGGSGTILQVSSDGSGTTLSVAFGGDAAQVVNVFFNGLSVTSGDLVEGASINFAGTITGMGTYGDASVPTVTADYVEVAA